MPPTPANGKVCYIEIPAVDINRSADFYSKVFGWRIRQRGDGHTAFDDTTGAVSGTWVVGRKASSEPGLLIYIMVDSVAATVDAVIAHGGALGLSSFQTRITCGTVGVWHEWPLTRVSTMRKHYLATWLIWSGAGRGGRQRSKPSHMCSRTAKRRSTLVGHSNRSLRLSSARPLPGMRSPASVAAERTQHNSYIQRRSARPLNWPHRHTG
jgi:predicted enzyme related to lactoylglutathione lyase